MSDKKKRKGDVSIGIIVDQDGEIKDEYIDDDRPIVPFIKPPEDAKKKRRPS